MNRCPLLFNLSTSVICSRPRSDNGIATSCSNQFATPLLRQEAQVLFSVRLMHRLPLSPRFLWRTLTETNARTTASIQWEFRRQQTLQLRLLQTLSDGANKS